MAHTVIMTRGEIVYSENFIKELSTRYVQWKRWDAKKKEMVDEIIKLRVCPIQLFDISYPIDYRDAVHATIFGSEKGKSINKRQDKYLLPLRFAMGLEPIGDYKNDARLPMNPPENIEILGIGMKDDYWQEPDGTHVDKNKKSEFATEGI